MIYGLGLRALGVEAGRGGHVEPLPGSYPLGVVDEHEGRGVVARPLDAGGAVRLVAQNEVEARGAFALRLLDHRQRVVGGEHHGQRILAPRAHCRRHVVRRGGDGNLQFLQRGVLVLPSGAGVRAHADVAVRQFPLVRPLAHGLREQGDGRHQVEHSATAACDVLGDAQRGERLARAARHHQLAAVVCLQPSNHVVEGCLLVRTQAEHRAPQRQVFRPAPRQIRPVERPFGQVAEA